MMACFNGADISRCRRAARVVLEQAREVRASMGPTSVDVGGTFALVRARQIEALQWGRHQSMSEGRRGPGQPGRDWPAPLQWGRHQSMSEGYANAAAITAISPKLQWGRHQSMSEGRAIGPGKPLDRVRASMGPTSVDVGGSRAGQKICLGSHLASMGPTSVDVGGRGSGPRDGQGHSRFNGADISRCRRAPDTTRAAARAS